MFVCINISSIQKDHIKCGGKFLEINPTPQDQSYPSSAVLNRGAAAHNDTLRWCQGFRQFNFIILLSFRPIISSKGADKY